MCRGTIVIGCVMAAMLANVPAFGAQASAARSAQAAAGTKATKAAAPKAPALGRVRATSASPVNINSATAAQLQTLPGVGASTAQRILDYRQKNGGFKKVEELMNVRGVGEKSFLKLKPLIVISSDRSAAAEPAR